MRLMRKFIRYLMRGLAPACRPESLNFIAVDTETTGLDPALCGIVEIGWTVVEYGKIVSSTSMLVLPGNPVALVDDNDMCRENFARSTVESNLAVDEALDAIRRAAEALRTRTGERPMLAFHNAPFDISFIVADRVYSPTGIRWMLQESEGPFSRRIIDTQAMVQPLVLSGELRSQSLKGICELLGVRPGSHRAADDSRATAECVIALLTRGWV